MTGTLRLCLAQFNPIAGAIADNAARMGDIIATSAADLVIFPELAICGYPVEDLVLRPAFVAACADGVEKLAQKHPDKAILIGAPWADMDAVRNSAFLLENGRLNARIDKQCLPNYGVFDEKRVFTAGQEQVPVACRGVRLGVLICEDMWFAEPALGLKAQGAEILVVINASPYHLGKHVERVAQARQRVLETGLPLVYVAQICGQDDLVFDGGSFAMQADGSIAMQMPFFQEASAEITLHQTRTGWRFETGQHDNLPETPEAELYAACVLGLGDYIRKSGFAKIVLGLSGGIDSALTAAMAVDAIGAENVTAIMLPSPYTSDESLRDATECATLLGIRLLQMPIGVGMECAGAAVTAVCGTEMGDLTAQNIQARLRGLYLMAFSNQTGAMLLSTGNKSEVAVGYCTLYGDMCGGYNPLKDLYKTQVFALCRWRNQQAKVIPENILIKPPSAELKPGQKDSDSLPPYEILDKILYGLIEQETSLDTMIAAGFDAETVTRVFNMVQKAEYKRQQSAPGPKISPHAFARDRRWPMVNRYQESVHGR